jgi:tetratricopeptide (TPR) repeat protein
MNKFWIAAIVLVGAGGAAAAARKADPSVDASSPKAKPPFYEKYLTDDDAGDRAIRDLTRQIDEKPDEPALRNDLGNLLARRGFAKEAVEQYREAERLEKTSYLPSYNEGLLWEKEGKPRKAMTAFRRSIRLKPGFPFSHFHLGVLEEKAGHESVAIAELAKALRIDNSLRLPSRNPLVVQTHLLHMASITNYSRDVASAVLVADGEFADPSVLARISPERFIDTREVAAAPAEDTDEEEAAPGAAPAVVAIPGNAPQSPAPAAPETRGSRNRERANRRGFAPRPRTQFPPQSVQQPPPIVQPAPAAEPAPEEPVPPQENPPEEEPPPPNALN